jgi:DNA-binding transcriptional ArsR family regulator
MAYTQVLDALGQPTRLALFERLRRRPHTVGELAAISRLRQPTVSQHLAVLRKARLVAARRKGTQRFYGVDQHGLAELRRYVEGFWDDVLVAYASADPAPPQSRRTRRTGR